MFYSPLDWKGFDLAYAAMDRVRFNFGCSVEVQLDDGSRHRLTLKRHRGSAGTDSSTLDELIDKKLRVEARSYFEEKQSVEKLLGRRESLEEGTVRECMSTFTGEEVPDWTPCEGFEVVRTGQPSWFLAQVS